MLSLMAFCLQPVDGVKVIEHVTRQSEDVNGDEPIPASFLLSSTMKRSDLRDATVSGLFESRLFFSARYDSGPVTHKKTTHDTDGSRFCRQGEENSDRN